MFTAIGHIVARLRALFRRREMDGDFAEEWQSHLAMLTDEQERQGMTRANAQRAARLRLGGAASLGEQHRAVRGMPGLESVVQDLRFAFRLMARDRGYSAAAIVALALGIGVNAIGFTIVNGAFLRGLPFEDADRIFVLTWQHRSGSRSSVSHPELLEWRTRTRTFAGLGGFSNARMNISDSRALPEEARGTFVTANAFAVLRQPLLLGRDFGPDDDRPGAEPVAILSYRVWKNRYGGAADIVGQPLRLNGRPATIVGVMPDGMNFPNNTEVWAPLGPEFQGNASRRAVIVFGRLLEGRAREDAQAELNGIAGQFAAERPETNRDLTGIYMQTFTERYVGGPARIIFLALMGAVSFVLLIACANVANLTLSRSAARARELAVRVALGATRWRTVRQLLIESVVLGCIGGALGLLLAAFGAQAIDAAIQDPDKPYWIRVTLDYSVIAYVAGICVLTGVLFGLAPALHVSRTDLNDVLKEGGRGMTGARRARWFSGSLVVVELALTIVLLAGAGLMVRSFLKLYSLDIGIRTEHLSAMRLQLPAGKYPGAEARRLFYEQLEPRLAAIPGVQMVAMTTAVPPGGSGQRDFEIEGRPPLAPGERPLNVSTVTIAPAFFEVAGVSLIRGRRFHETDGAPGFQTVIVNERMAAEFFRGEDPISRRIRFVQQERPAGEPAAPWLTIVGISPTVRQGSTQRLGGEPNAVVYLPYRQDPPAAASLLVRSALPPESVMDAVRRVVQAIDPDQPVFTIQTLDQILAQERWPFRVFGGLFALLAAIALVLSSVGLYAVMAYAVSQRTQEIGVRIALGGQSRQMYWLILKRGLLQLGIGLTLGLAGALALSRILTNVVAGITPTDPVTYIVTVAVLTGVSIAACLVPAHRATRIDPIVALRAE